FPLARPVTARHIHWRESCSGARPSSDGRAVLAVIPARLGATRLPRKPLRLLGGIPLVVRVWQSVMEMGVATRCVVATDSDEVATAVRAAGAECIMTRTDHQSGTDRVAEVASRPDFSRYDAIVNVQGDEPFVQRAAVAGAAELVTSGRFPLGTAAAPAGDDVLQQPQVVKVVTADDGRAMYFSRAGIPFRRDGGGVALTPPLVRQHVGVYAYTRDALARWVALPPHPLECVEKLEQLRPLAAGIPMGVALVPVAPLGGIDTEDDLARASAYWDDFRRGRA
ncbi:MAG TPA: 3-deoxy-manno-octulosonate cytidylyltransferase, partial [Gemmatimonadaceae bacterium]|nr:3-deoxy-manno-octulosonate cytidylyltransferase [Gemmatimonadaceae bacterium]